MFNIVWILSLKTKMSHWFIQLSFLDLQCFVVQWQICWPVLLVDRSILRHLLLRSLKKNYRIYSIISLASNISLPRIYPWSVTGLKEYNPTVLYYSNISPPLIDPWGHGGLKILLPWGYIWINTVSDNIKDKINGHYIKNTNIPIDLVWMYYWHKLY